jgi:hypothetical protein
MVFQRQGCIAAHTAPACPCQKSIIRKRSKKQMQHGKQYHSSNDDLQKVPISNFELHHLHTCRSGVRSPGNFLRRHTLVS